MPLVTSVSGYVRDMLLAAALTVGGFWTLFFIGTQDYNHTSQPWIRYPAMSALAGGAAICGVVLVWLARSRGGVLVRGTEDGLIVLPPIWPLRRTFLPVQHSDRALTSISVLDRKSGEDLGSNPQQSNGPWILVVETPTEELRVNLYGIQVLADYGEKLDLWRQARPGETQDIAGG